MLNTSNAITNNILSKLSGRSIINQTVPVISTAIEDNGDGSCNIIMTIMPCVELSVSGFLPTHVQCGINIEFMDCFFDETENNYVWGGDYNFVPARFYTNFLWGARSHKSNIVKWDVGTRFDISKEDDVKLQRSVANNINADIQNHQLKDIFIKASEMAIIKKSVLAQAA